MYTVWIRLDEGWAQLVNLHSIWGLGLRLVLGNLLSACHTAGNIFGVVVCLEIAGVDLAGGMANT